MISKSGSLILIRLNQVHVPLKWYLQKLRPQIEIVNSVSTRRFHDIKESCEIQMDKKIDLFRLLFSIKLLMNMPNQGLDNQ